MKINITHELYSFGIVAAGIAAVCILFDLFREFYHIFGIKGRLRSVIDILFWVCALIMVWFSLMSADNGRLRFYQSAGGFLVTVLYFFVFSMPIRYVFKKFLKFFKLILKILLTPAHFLYKILYRLLIIIRDNIIRIIKEVRNKNAQYKNKTNIRKQKNKNKRQNKKKDG